jgi:anti-sigma factor RsiW
VSDGCRDVLCLLGPCVDGELDVEKQAELESHVDGCETCQERVALLRAMKGSLRHVTKTEAPAGFRARALAAMQAEQARAVTREAQKRVTPWRTVVPLASAAAFALMWGVMSRGPGARTTALGAEQAGFGDELLAELVSEHSKPLPYDARDPSEVQKFEQYVGVPVHTTSLGKNCPPGSGPSSPRPCMHASFVGARVLPVRQERAAMLHYEVQDGNSTRRVSVIVFDPRRIQISDADLQPRPVGTSNVQVGHANGYSVAVTERAGVGYAMAGDLDESQMAELAVYRGE